MDLLPSLPAFDAVFVRTALEHRGGTLPPTLAEYAAAFDLLRRYYQQCLDNPREDEPWAPHLTEESLAAMRAKAFVLFGATKPTPAQWQKVHAALYGTLLAEAQGLSGRVAGHVSNLARL
jgi:hypothetical protein